MMRRAVQSALRMSLACRGVDRMTPLDGPSLFLTTTLRAAATTGGFNEPPQSSAAFDPFTASAGVPPPHPSASGLTQRTPCLVSREKLQAVVEGAMANEADGLRMYSSWLFNAALPKLNMLTEALLRHFGIASDDCQHRCGKCGCTPDEHDTKEIVQLREKEAAKAAAEELLVADLRSRRIALGDRLKRVRLVDDKLRIDYVGREGLLKTAKNLLAEVGETKELCKPLIIYSAPRQGKSRLMDEIADKCDDWFGKGEIFCVAMSYNGKENNFSNNDIKVEGFSSRFFGRFLLASLKLDKVADADPYFLKHPVLNTLTAVDFDRILRKVHDLGEQRVVLLADEFSKCYLRAAGTSLVRLENGTYVVSPALKSEISKIYQLIGGVSPRADALPVYGNKIIVSGFSDEAAGVLASERPVVEITFPLINAASRADYKEMYDKLFSHYGKEKFPVMLYEVVKSCVGLLGYWLQFPDAVNPLAVLRWNVPWSQSLQREANTYSLIAEAYLEHWARGGSTNTFVKDNAAKFDLIDAGSSVMFLPLGGDSHVAHPYPFYVLVQKVAADKMHPCLRHLRTVFDIIEKCATSNVRLSNTLPTGVRAMRKHHKPIGVGEAFEQVVRATLRMRLVGFGLGGSISLLQWLSSWTRTTFGEADSITVQRRGTTMDPPSVELQLRRTMPITINFKHLANMRDAHRDDKEKFTQAVAGAACAKVLLENEVFLPFDDNPGFDVGAVLNGSDGRREGLVLVLIETKKQDERHLTFDTAEKFEVTQGGKRVDFGEAHRDGTGTPVLNSTREQHQNAARFTATRKACLTLRNIYSTLPYLKDGSGKQLKILHVAFVALFAGNVKAEFDFDPFMVRYKDQALQKKDGSVEIGESKNSTKMSVMDVDQSDGKGRHKNKKIEKKFDLQARIEELKSKDCTVSLHTVAGQDELETFFTGAVYHSIPDGEWYIHEGLPKNQKKRK